MTVGGAGGSAREGSDGPRLGFTPATVVVIYHILRHGRARAPQPCVDEPRVVAEGDPRVASQWSWPRVVSLSLVISTGGRQEPFYDGTERSQSLPLGWRACHLPDDPPKEIGLSDLTVTCPTNISPLLCALLAVSRLALLGSADAGASWAFF